MMKSLFNYLKGTNKKKLVNIYKNSSRYCNYISSIGLIFWASNCFSLPAYAEGSRNMYPSGSPGNRGSILWTNTTWGGTQNFNERTLLRVFAKQGEYILMGSSAVNVGNGDIVVYDPGQVSGDASKEILGTSSFSCKTQGGGKGKINTRAEELAGPRSVDGNSNTGGYIPCFYQAPTTGIYFIAMYGPSGSNSSGQGTSSPNTGIRNDQTIETINTAANQNASISAWDVSVRSSSQSSTTNITGRLFTMLIAMNMGDNGKRLNSILYPVTVDGYRYKVTMRGLDPFGFRIFGNQIGNLDSDGTTPLYRDVLGSDGNISSPKGGTNTAPPQFPIFFNPPSDEALNLVTLYDKQGKKVGNGIPLIPIPPEVTSPNFKGTSSGNISRVNTGGTFTFNTNVPANYQIIISRDGVNYDPSNPLNRVLRGSIPIPGQQTVTWNGKDNNAQPFPVGDYPYRVQIQSGEYHFPLSDAENNVSGGPTIELLNFTNPLGNFTAFFDDRMYTTVGGTQVKGENQTYDPTQALCGINPPNPPFSDPVNGGDSRSSTFRNFGTNTGGNTNNECTGSFGDTKTLDTWIYVPSQAKQEQLKIVAPGFDVSGTLYEDANASNTFDTTEPRLPKDITVSLYKDANNNNIIDTGELVSAIATNATGDYSFTNVADGTYKIKVDLTDVDIPDKYALGTPNDLAVNVSGSGVTNQNFGFNKYEVSPSAGKVIINEVLYNETGNSAATNDEFIEIYNASTSPVDLGGWKLMDGNLIANDTDNTGSITGSSTPYAFPNSTILKPGEYAVIWVGDETNTPDRKATGAKFQAWLGKAPKLNNSGDDMWLYDRDTKIVDYIAYGSGTAINTPPPTSLNLWDNTHQSALAGASDGQSISLTKNGLDGNTSACWEPTTSANAQTQGCANYLPTIDSDDTVSRVTSAGENNNGTPNVLLVKRISAINGQTTNPNDNTTPLNTVVDDTASPRQGDDNHPNWASDYLKGAINGGPVKPGDELEYTIYFLSAGSTPAKNVLFCDRVPQNVSFIPNSFNNQPNRAANGLQSADRGILWLKDGNTESLTNAQDGDFAQYFPPSIEPSTVYPKIKCDGLNTNGAVVVNLGNLPNATDPGEPNTSYGYIKFRGRVK